MSCYVQGSESVLDYVAQAEFGTIPDTPTLKRIPVRTHSLNLVKERVQGMDFLGDRLPTDDRHGTRRGEGTIEVDLRGDDYDEFLESAFFNTFNAGELKVGSTPKYLLVEDGVPEKDLFRRFTSLAVNQATFSIQPDQMVQATFDCRAQQMITSNSTISAEAATAPSGNAPFDSFSGKIYEGGTAGGDEINIVTSLQFSIQNSLNPIYAIGSDIATCMEYGMAVVEGTMSVYYKDMALINKFLAEVETSLSVSVSDPSVSPDVYTFNFPRVKLNGASVPLANPQSRIIELPFVALRSASDGTNLILTKS